MTQINGDELLDRLTLEIELAWNARGDSELVDRLAREYPTLAVELYGFFADLVEATLGLDKPRSEFEPADKRMQEWLEREGYRRLASDYLADATETVNTPTDKPLTPPTQDYPQRRIAEPFSKLAGFLGLLRKVTGARVESLAEVLDITPSFLVDISEHAATLPEKARRELLRRLEKVPGVRASDFASVLVQPYRSIQRAASRSFAYEAKALTFEDIVRRSDLDDKRKRFWLSLA